MFMVLLLPLASPANAQVPADKMQGGGTSAPQEDPGGATTTPEEGAGGGSTSGDSELESAQNKEKKDKKCGFTEFDCWAEKGFLKILGFLYEKFVKAGIQEIGDALAETAFGLPEPSGELIAKYQALVEKVKPGILLGILMLGLMMMIQSANYNVAYTTQHGLPKLAFVAATLVFFPEFMQMVSDVSTGVAKSFLGEAEISGAAKQLVVGSITGNLTGAGVFVIIGQLAILGIGALVVCVAFLKNMAFSILFMAGPIALIAYPLPGLSSITGAWFRGIMACAIIPLLFSVEITVGTWVIKAPELIFGPGGAVLPVFSLIASAMLLWIMWKTPFKVLEWAFQSYSHGGGRTFLGSLTRSVATGLTMKGISSAGGALLKGGGGPPSPRGSAAPAGSGPGKGPAGGLSLGELRARAQNMHKDHPAGAVAQMRADDFAKFTQGQNQMRAIRHSSSVPDVFSSSSLGSSPGSQSGVTGPGTNGSKPSGPNTHRSSSKPPVGRKVSHMVSDLRWTRGPGGGRGVILDPETDTPTNRKGG